MTNVKFEEYFKYFNSRSRDLEEESISWDPVEVLREALFQFHTNGVPDRLDTASFLLTRIFDNTMPYKLKELSPEFSKLISEVDSRLKEHAYQVLANTGYQVVDRNCVADAYGLLEMGAVMVDSGTLRGVLDELEKYKRIALNVGYIGE